MSLYRSIRIREEGGAERTIQKAVVKQPVADLLVPGAKGRFYLFKALDTGGIHGVRLPGAPAVFAFPDNNKSAFLISGIVAVLWIAFTLATCGGVPLLGVGLLGLASIGWYFMSRIQAEAKAQFDGDSGPVS